MVGSLPLGWKQKITFSVALLHDPKIIFLDEPTGGVDPITRRQFWEMIYQTAHEGTTVFVTTYFYTGIFLLVILGMGFFISNFTDTQQQAMFIAWFFVVIFILMSRLFTPIESMPIWAQNLTELNPIKYFVGVMRMVMLKGASLQDILPQLLKTTAYAVVMNSLSVWSYRKTTFIAKETLLFILLFLNSSNQKTVYLFFL